MDCSPPGSPVPWILQARTLEWVAISFSNAWKWKVKVKTLSRVWLFATPWTTAYQAPLSMGFSRQEYWSGVPLPSPRWKTVFLKMVLQLPLNFPLWHLAENAANMPCSVLNQWLLLFAHFGAPQEPIRQYTPDWQKDLEPPNIIIECHHQFISDYMYWEKFWLPDSMEKSQYTREEKLLSQQITSTLEFRKNP